MAWRAIPGPLSKRKRRLDSLEAGVQQWKRGSGRRRVQVLLQAALVQEGLHVGGGRRRREEVEGQAERGRGGRGLREGRAPASAERHQRAEQGGVTDLEPDILECEVKWALESITTNKASGGDGIPVELFQILTDDAVKVLHSI